MPRRVPSPLRLTIVAGGFTYQDVGDGTGYAAVTIANVANGHSRAWPEFRRRVSAFLGRPEAELFPQAVAASPEELAEIAERLRREQWHPRGVPEVPTPEMMTALARLIRQTAPSPAPEKTPQGREARDARGAGVSGPPSRAQGPDANDSRSAPADAS